jgi:hypothetical protein
MYRTVDYYKNSKDVAYVAQLYIGYTILLSVLVSIGHHCLIFILFLISIAVRIYIVAYICFGAGLIYWKQC